MKRKHKYLNTKTMVICGLIAAIYAGLTLLLAPISFGMVQFRISEALTVLPFVYPPAVIGLFIGCITANFFTPNLTLLDVVFGSLATLLAAVATMKIRNKYLAPLPPVVVNAVIIGIVIQISYGGYLPFNMISVGLGQCVVCFGLGLPLLLMMERTKLTEKITAN